MEAEDFNKFDFNKIDWKQLKKQKLSLLNVLDAKLLSREEEEDLTSILHLLDYLQDCAVDEAGISETDVFLNEEEPDDS